MADDKRAENLMEPWKPGQSGNKKGKPNGAVSMKTRIERVLGMCANEMKEDGKFPDGFIENISAMYGNASVADAMVIKMLSNALLKKNSERGMRDLLDRLEGKPPQTIEIGQAGSRLDMNSEAMKNMTQKNALKIYQQMMKDTSIVIDAEVEVKDARTTD